jgi:hypothetical protein
VETARASEAIKKLLLHASQKQQIMKPKFNNALRAKKRRRRLIVNERRKSQTSLKKLRGVNERQSK